MSYLKEHGDGNIHLMHIAQPDNNLHPHTFFELVYVVKGTAIHVLEQTQMSITAGDYFIVDPGSSHCYANTRHLEIVNCLFMPEYIDRALVHTPSLSALLKSQIMRFGIIMELQAADRVFHDEDGAVWQLIRLMEQEYQHKHTGYTELLRCLLTQVLVLTVRAAEQAEHPVHPATKAVAEYLRNHLTQPLSLKILSDHCGYAPQYICNLFRKDMGMTLQTYLQKLRIAQAQKLLEAGSTDPSVLAQKVGYNDPKHFAQLYRRHTGHTLRSKMR